MVLCVRAEIGESSVHGRGLFAKEDIPKGTEIWRYDPVFDLTVSAEALHQLPAPSCEQLLKYSYHCKDTGLYVISMDDSRFMNHSDSPNTGEDFGEGVQGTTVAARDIKSGEELTTNYFEYDLDAPIKLGIEVKKSA